MRVLQALKNPCCFHRYRCHATVLFRDPRRAGLERVKHLHAIVLRREHDDACDCAPQRETSQSNAFDDHGSARDCISPVLVHVDDGCPYIRIGWSYVRKDDVDCRHAHVVQSIVAHGQPAVDACDLVHRGSSCPDHCVDRSPGSKPELAGRFFENDRFGWAPMVHAICMFACVSAVQPGNDCIDTWCFRLQTTLGVL